MTNTVQDIFDQAPRPDEYAPYHTLDAFRAGVAAYASNQYRNPHEGVDAQAWDRGLEFGMRAQRYLDQIKDAAQQV